ncbi:MAG: hypothetical protein Q7R52_02815 [archaeon]|nr:hypothetical protein [archaeon]
MKKTDNDDIILNIFKNKIKNINVKEFKRILDDDISLFEYFGSKMPSRSSVKMTMSIFNINPEIINFNNILKCFREGNIEAYRLIIFHDNGILWFKKTIRELKENYQ